MAKKFKSSRRKQQWHPENVAVLTEFLGRSAGVSSLRQDEEIALLKIIVKNRLSGMVVEKWRKQGRVAKNLVRIAMHKAWLCVRSELVQRNLRLVAWVAQRFINFVGKSEFGDLLQQGVFGLMRAADGFDLKFSTRFSTYATDWIRKNMQDVVLMHSRKTLHDVRVLVNFRCAQVKLTKKLGREPLVAELSQYMKTRVEKIWELIELERGLVSLDESVGGCEMMRHELIPDEHQLQPDDALAFASLPEFVISRLDRLQHKYRTVIMMRFGLGGYEKMTLEQVGNMLGRTTERVRQIQNLALERLGFDEELFLAHASSR